MAVFGFPVVGTLNPTTSKLAELINTSPGPFSRIPKELPVAFSFTSIKHYFILLPSDGSLNRTVIHTDGSARPSTAFRQPSCATPVLNSFIRFVIDGYHLSGS